ncbi:hypothetical protein Bca101_036837 [Brassica carinata]
MGPGRENRTVRITSAPPVKQVAGAAGKYLVGQQSSGHSTKGGHTEQVREIGPAPLYKKQGPLREVKPNIYGSRGSSPGRGKESKSMDINEPSLMDVAHDTINSTQGPALIEMLGKAVKEKNGSVSREVFECLKRQQKNLIKMDGVVQYIHTSQRTKILYQ